MFFFFFFNTEEEYIRYSKDITINSKKYIARSLSRFRKHYNKTLKEVSKATEIPYQTISRYENEENDPSVNQAIRLANYYKVGIDELIYFGSIDDDEIMIEEYKKYLETVENKQPLDIYKKT